MIVREYGARVLRPDERVKLYEHRRGDGDELVARQAAGIPIKRRMLERLNMIPKHRALVVVPRRRKARTARS